MISKRNNLLFKYKLSKIITCFSFFICSAQTVTKSGKITDTLKNPLAYANLLAIPQSDDEGIRFAITKENGSYELILSKNQTYELTVSYLGFQPKVIQITTTDQNLSMDFVLQESSEQLDEITLNYTPPITIKKDTITYRVDKFTTGKERKLREVLKKLPGVEVDRDGNVKVQGKKVTKVLVENRTFFTGNSKLAVNNIPADAVDEVEVLDNYNEVAMLKGLQDTEDMAMNIKLKEHKKKFVFGDIEGGAGIEDRYLIHPNLFYYSPKTNVNFIGDLNNQGVKSFSFSDYLEFEGGFGKLMQNTNSYFSLFNSDFARYLNNKNFINNINRFGAIQLRQSLTASTDISSYFMASSANTNTSSSALNIYQNSSDPFTEERTTNTTLNSFFAIGKFTIDYNPTYNEDITYNSFIKVTNNDSYGIVNTTNPTQTNTINTFTDITGINLKQHLSYSLKLSKAHTATLEATYSFNNDKPITEWLTNQQILQGLIPLEEDTIYNILQTKHSRSHNINAIIKEYWVLNNFNHIYTSFGVNMAFNNFFNTDKQLLSNGTVNNFSSAGFGNDFNYDFINTYLGLEYKFMIGIATFKPAVYFHSYLWITQQLESKQTRNKTLILPQFTSKIEFGNSEKINFRYRLNTRFPSINRLANNFILSSFNSVYRGNETLENQLYHSASLSYYKFSLYRNLNFNLNTNFNKRIKTIKSVTELNGIESFNTPILFDQPEHSWSLSGRISKKINKIRYNLSTRFNYNDFFQILNNTTNLNISKSISSTIGLETYFKNYPNLEINYTKDFSNYKAIGNTSNFENDRLEFFLEYNFLKDFILKADYTFDNYRNKNQNITTTFDTANASLFYQKEDSPWGFEINATNIFDVRFKQSNTFNAFVISDNRTFIMPRILMFKLSYKL